MNETGGAELYAQLAAVEGSLLRGDTDHGALEATRIRPLMCFRNVHELLVDKVTLRIPGRRRPDSL